MNHFVESSDQITLNEQSMFNPQQTQKNSLNISYSKSTHQHVLQQQRQDSPFPSDRLIHHHKEDEENFEEAESLQEKGKGDFARNSNELKRQFQSMKQMESTADNTLGLLESKQFLQEASFITSYRLNQSYFTKEDLREQESYSQIVFPSEKQQQKCIHSLEEPYQYFGGIQNSMKHGWGILITCKFIYEGKFSLNNKNGKGYINYLQNKSKYFGDFSNNKPNGSGLLQYGEEYYIGDFENGCMNGDGLWKNQKGEKYIGKWKSNKAHGYGMYVTEKSHFQGEFSNFDKHGHGIQNFMNGDTYKGNYVKGKPHGYGEYFWENGITYKGNFVEGLRQGDGAWNNQLGDEYLGHFSVDHKNGYGEYKWANGNIYKGEFCQDMREGSGQMIWNDGSVYEGEWKRGLPNGKGTFKVKGQRQKHGIFQDNVLVEELPMEQKRNLRIKSSRKITSQSHDRGYNFQKSKVYVNMPHPELLKRRTGSLNKSSSNHRKGKSLYKTTGSTMVTNFQSKGPLGSRRHSHGFRFT